MLRVDRIDIPSIMLKWADGVIDSDDVSFLKSQADLYLNRELSANDASHAVILRNSSSPEKIDIMLVILNEITSRFIYDHQIEAFTNQKYDRKKRPGYIYCATNPSLKGLIKIGMTTKTPEVRLKQLSKSASIPDDFCLEWSVATSDTYADEIIFHKILADYRYSKEFFTVCPREALSIINRHNKKTR